MNKKTSESKVIYTYSVMPKDLNTGGSLFGGVIFDIIDHSSGTCAIKHLRSSVTTASVDLLNYLKPIYKGDFLHSYTFISGVGNTSVEVFTKILKEDPLSGKRELCVTAFLTFKAKKLEPGTLPKIIGESEEEKIIIDGYEERRKRNKERLIYNKNLINFIKLDD